MHKNNKNYIINRQIFQQNKLTQYNIVRCRCLMEEKTKPIRKTLLLIYFKVVLLTLLQQKMFTVPGLVILSMTLYGFVRKGINTKKKHYFTNVQYLLRITSHIGVKKYSVLHICHHKLLQVLTGHCHKSVTPAKVNNPFEFDHDR